MFYTGWTIRASPSGPRIGIHPEPTWGKSAKGQMPIVQFPGRFFITSPFPPFTTMIPTVMCLLNKYLLIIASCWGGKYCIGHCGVRQESREEEEGKEREKEHKKVGRAPP